jgi:hypothetical protein
MATGIIRLAIIVLYLMMKPKQGLIGNLTPYTLYFESNSNLKFLFLFNFLSIEHKYLQLD